MATISHPNEARCRKKAESGTQRDPTKVVIEAQGVGADLAVTEVSFHEGGIDQLGLISRCERFRIVLVALYIDLRVDRHIGAVAARE